MTPGPILSQPVLSHKGRSDIPKIDCRLLPGKGASGSSRQRSKAKTSEADSTFKTKMLEGERAKRTPRVVRNAEEGGEEAFFALEDGLRNKVELGYVTKKRNTINVVRFQSKMS